MTVLHILKLSIAVILASLAGWIALFGLSVLLVWRAIESLAVAQDGSGIAPFERILVDVLRGMQGGGAIFLVASLSCVVLSEVFRTRSILYYAGLSGALALAAAAALASPAANAHIGQAGSVLAIAGFTAGAVYWLIARPS